MTTNKNPARIDRIGTMQNKSLQNKSLRGWSFDAQGGPVHVSADGFMGYSWEQLELLADIAARVDRHTQDLLITLANSLTGGTA